MRYDDPNIGASAMVGLVGAIALFVVIVLLQALFYRMQTSEQNAKVSSQPNQGVQALDAEQLEQLTSYEWVSQPDGVVRIPVERAMELVVAESGRGTTGS